MSNHKFKNENYNNLGGINSKFSRYELGPLEFLDLKNFDFQTPGALTQRWGSTQYVTQTFGNAITSLYEYSKLDGSSYVLVGHTGGLWFGATTGNSQGMSFTATGTTLATAIVCKIPEGQWTAAAGGGVVFQSYPIFYQGATATGAYIDNNSGFTVSINPLSNSSNKISFQTINNYLFAADGTKFIKFDGATTRPVGLFPPAVLSSFQASLFTGDTTSIGVIGPTFGSYKFYASYVNERGFESQIWPIGFIDTTTPGTSIIPSSLMINLTVDLLTPSRYGISTINVYSHFSAFSVASLSPTDMWSPNYVQMTKYAASGGETTRIVLGTTLGGMTNLIYNLGKSPNTTVNSYYPFGLTLSFGSTAIAGPITNIAIANNHPRFLEVYANRLFGAGFSGAPSTVGFSDPAEPEGFALSNNFEVRTNDSDFITCIRSYSTRFYIFKRASFHALYGDSPDNFFLQQVSNIYGCLNNDCAVTFENTLIFLDQKGVMMFDGSSVACLSDKIQPIFDRMNFSSAITSAVMVHDKLRNEVLIGIPVDGATTNNITLVYDYMAKAWTTYDGFVPSVFARIQGRNNTKNAFYGTPSGTISWFGPSFLSDNGSGYTLYFKSRFLHDLGESIQKQVRRLYIDADTGTTFTMPLKFYQDYGSSVVYSTTLVLSQFQDRIDFGISCKSIAFELYNLQSTSPLRINGFTVESRLQRRV